MFIDRNHMSLYANKNIEKAERILKDNVRKWEGSQCPSYVDIDLDGNYRLEKLLVDTGKGYSKYCIFTSENGTDYSLAYDKNNENEKDEYIPLKSEASSIRIFIKFNSVSNNAVIRYIELFGEKT